MVADLCGRIGSSLRGTSSEAFCSFRLMKMNAANAITSKRVAMTDAAATGPTVFAVPGVGGGGGAVSVTLGEVVVVVLAEVVVRGGGAIGGVLGGGCG